MNNPHKNARRILGLAESTGPGNRTWNIGTGFRYVLLCCYGGKWFYHYSWQPIPLLVVEIPRETAAVILTGLLLPGMVSEYRDRLKCLHKIALDEAIELTETAGEQFNLGEAKAYSLTGKMLKELGL